MNEKIKELALQSMSNVRFWNAEKESYEVEHNELEKFARLVIHSCMNELYKEGLWSISISAALMGLFKPEQEQLKTEEHSVLRQAVWDTAEVVAPPQRPWVGLTDEELSEVYNNSNWDFKQSWDYERAIEANLRSKNT